MHNVCFRFVNIDTILETANVLVSRLSNLKVWKFIESNSPSAILSKLTIAFRANNYAVIGFSPAYYYGYSGNSILSNFLSQISNKFTALRTDNALPILPVLLKLSFSDSSSRKLHCALPPSEWHKGCIEDYWHYANGKWTGMIINTITRLWVSRTKVIRLKHPSYHISFSSNANTSQILHLLEVTKLRDAKELAESYYKEWLKVNTKH